MARERHDKEAATATAHADVLVCRGDWTVGSINTLRVSLDDLVFPAGGTVTIDGNAIDAMDTAGAWLLLLVRQQAETAGKKVRFTGFQPAQSTLLDYIAAESSAIVSVPAGRRRRSILDRWTVICADLVHFLAFIGEAVISLIRGILRPGRIRWHEILADMFETGVKALPIVGLLSFLMGVVIAYQGAVQLKLYGANIYIADMVGYAMLRELAPLLAAILVCGRTGSAYAAQIGTMQVREEVAALQTIGIPPVDMLVLPKVLSLIIVMPLLSVYADVLAVFGGMVMANVQLGLGFNAFLFRLEEAISYSTFMIGISKAPVFAAIIAIVGCYQGFKVQGSAESVGRHTTISVVQSIFLVIVTDAMFSILFSVLGV
jgi:phospholipid/cholesterol/gamma-HCH transport system permease protein